MKPEIYTKKQIDIQAMKFEYTVEGVAALKEFVGEFLGEGRKEKRLGAKAEIEIKTLEDGSQNQVKHIATEGDYIIKGIKGEFYPCKAEIFKKTYNKKSNMLESEDGFQEQEAIKVSYNTWCEKLKLDGSIDIGNKESAITLINTLVDLFDVEEKELDFL